jgi:hypothetical protein
MPGTCFAILELISLSLQTQSLSRRPREKHLQDRLAAPKLLNRRKTLRVRTYGMRLVISSCEHYNAFAEQDEAVIGPKELSGRVLLIGMETLS